MNYEILGNLVRSMPCSFGDNYGMQNNSVFVAKVSNISGDGHFKTPFELRDFSNKEKKSLLVSKDDLLVVKSSGSKLKILSGKTALCTQKEENKLIASNFLLRLQPFVSKVVPKYLWYFLNSNYSKIFIRSIVGATTYPNLKWNLYKLLSVPLPPLEAQKKIAAILDKADELRCNDQKILEKYDQLAQSVFLEMFGDPVYNKIKFDYCTIRDLVKEVKYGTSSKASQVGKYPYLRMNNITYSGYLDFSDLKYIDLKEKDKEKYLVKKGDLLFNRTNSKELVGKTAVYGLKEPMAIAGYLIKVRVNSFANPYFIWGYLNSKHGKKTLENMCKSIVGMANINAQELQNIMILKPPIELQDKFAEIIKQIEVQKQLTQKSFKRSEELFQSLLQKAFRKDL